MMQKGSTECETGSAGCDTGFRRRSASIALVAGLALAWSAGAAAQMGSAPGSDVASLEERELGQPYTEDGERVIYDRALPFLAQQVIDLGFEMPRPYGAQMIGYWQEQDLILDNLSVSIDGGEYQDIDFVDFGTPSVENTTAQAKLDAWLFPFMNVYVSLGQFTGDGAIPLAVEGRDLLEFLGLGRLCGGGVLEPAFCSRILTTVAEPEYKGDAVALGMNLAMGWEDYFVTIPISHAWTDVDIINETVTAWNISPRIGYLHSFENAGSIALYTGATWLKAEVDLSGTAVFDTAGSGIAEIGDATTLDFVIRQRNRDRWNYLVGFNWELSRAWSLQAEVGFGGSRDNAIVSGTYRW
ncbi:MAG: hypothetical protein P8X98_01435 [Woeseiaceae bacterium]